MAQALRRIRDDFSWTVRFFFSGGSAAAVRQEGKGFPASVENVQAQRKGFLIRRNSTFKRGVRRGAVEDPRAGSGQKVHGVSPQACGGRMGLKRSMEPTLRPQVLRKEASSAAARPAIPMGEASCSPLGRLRRRWRPFWRLRSPRGKNPERRKRRAGTRCRKRPESLRRAGRKQ